MLHLSCACRWRATRGACTVALLLTLVSACNASHNKYRTLPLTEVSQPKSHPAILTPANCTLPLWGGVETAVVVGFTVEETRVVLTGLAVVVITDDFAVVVPGAVPGVHCA